MQILMILLLILDDILSNNMHPKKIVKNFTTKQNNFQKTLLTRTASDTADRACTTSKLIGIVATNSNGPINDNCFYCSFEFSVSIT